MTQGAAARDWFPLATLACVLPLVLATYPAMVDMPQHAAQVAAIRHLVTGDGWKFASFFELQWLTPYLFGYLLALGLSFLVGVPLALKLVLAGAFVLFQFSGARLIRASRGDPAWRWLLLPLPFGLAYHWGFFNFLVAAPLGLLFLASVVEMNGRSDWKACVRMSAWLHLLFIAHVLTAAFFSVAGILILASPWKGVREWVRRCVPVLTILPMAGIWFVSNLVNAPPEGEQVLWNLGLNRLVDFLPGLVSSPDRFAGQLLGLFFLAVPFLLGGRPRRSIAAWMPFAFYVGWMLAFPHYLGGTFFTCERFGIFGIPLYLLGFEKRNADTPAPEYTRSLVPGLAIICLAMLGWQSLRVLTFNREVAGYVEVMDKAGPGGRVLMMAFDPVSKASSAPLLLHFSGWYQAERDGLSEYSFSGFWGVPARFRADAPTVISQGFEWHPDTFDWQDHRGDLFDYFLIRHPVNADTWIRERTGGRAVLVARSGEWQLYGRQQVAQSTRPQP